MTTAADLELRKQQNERARRELGLSIQEEVRESDPDGDLQVKSLVKDGVVHRPGDPQ